MNKKIKISLLSLAISMIGSNSMAQNGAISFPEIPYKSQAQVDAYKKGCDYNVYAALYEKAKVNGTYYTVNTATPQIKEQTSNTPTAQAQSSCLESAIGQINNIAKSVGTVMSILGGNTDWSAIADKAGTQLKNMACSQVNSYASNTVYKNTSGIVNGVNGVTNTVGGVGVNTPVGNINVGGDIINQAQQKSYATPGILK